MKRLIVIFLPLLMACSSDPGHFETEVLNAFTPVKDQGTSQTCWIYAMLSAIETEHIMRGDSVHLSVAWMEKMMEQDSNAPKSKRGMGGTALYLLNRYGICGYDAMRKSDVPPPFHVFMYGAEYTPLEFAHSVCAPDEYELLTTDDRHPYGQKIEIDSPDNWTHDRYQNLSPDSLLAITERAVRQHHGVCWEGDISEWGFNFQHGVARKKYLYRSTTDDHCMAIVGIAHDQQGERYFIMKNSWGKGNEYGGLMYMSFDYFLHKTIAVILPKEN